MKRKREQKYSQAGVSIQAFIEIPTINIWLFFIWIARLAIANSLTIIIAFVFSTET